MKDSISNILSAINCPLYKFESKSSRAQNEKKMREMIIDRVLSKSIILKIKRNDSQLVLLIVKV